MKLYLNLKTDNDLINVIVFKNKKMHKFLEYLSSYILTYCIL